LPLKTRAFADFAEAKEALRKSIAARPNYAS
jgi:hypothetical protein